MARTGSGKTGAFLIPMIEKLKCHSQIVGARCVILSPTREIAMQTASFFKSFSKFTDLRYALLVGGNEMETQFEKLAQNPDVIIATPGRLMHHINEVGLSLNMVEIAIYDEADRIFEMGFAEQIVTINNKMPKNKQILLFSATIPPSLANFTLSGIGDYKMIKLHQEYTLSDQLKCHFFITRSTDKPAALLYLLKEHIKEEELTIIFAATKYHVDYLQQLLLTAGLKSNYIYGAMDQSQRENAVALFRKKRFPILIVTDVAARGIDIPFLSNVIHYDFPPSMKLFIHRSGRTARNGQSGRSFSLLTKHELPFLIEASIYVGRKYVNNVDELSPEDRKEALENPSISLYGQILQKVLDTYSSDVETAYDRNSNLEALEKVMKNALKKYNKHKNSASTASVKTAKELGIIGIHPLTLNRVGTEDAALINFQNAIKSFRPKMNAIECMYTRYKQDKDLERLQDILNKQKKEINKRDVQQKVKEQAQKLKEEAEEDIYKKERKAAERQKKIEEANAQLEDKSQKKLNLSAHDRKKLKKMNKKERQMFFEALKENPKKNKRQKIAEEGSDKKSEFYITYDKDEKAENMWGKNEKFNMEDLNLNLLPDDEKSLLKTQQSMKWDAKKKKYVQVNERKDGSKIKNEAGKVINYKKDKDPELYKKWVKRTHLKIQDTGEHEDKRTVDNAQQFHQGRRDMKRMGKKASNIKGKDKQQVRKMEQIEKMKKKKRKVKELQKGKRRNPNSASSRAFQKRIQNKVEARSRPTRSKIILSARK
uniref:RNA helicase n=1 Tax=Euplotes crassus TaxID=5936 RepID=A0A7S3KPE4_EUPCR